MADPSNPLDQSISTAGDAALFTPAYLENRRRALEQLGGPRDMDDGDPKLPAGHAYAIRKSTWITSEFRGVHRKGAMDITPQDVIDALNAGGVKNWVLMGLHGYVGYMPNPRATRDVDIMVPYSARQRAKKAISARWPTLQIRELSQVTRFADPADLDAECLPKQVIDLMRKPLTICRISGITSGSSSRLLIFPVVTSKSFAGWPSSKWESTKPPSFVTSTR
jgi:hypothetical protein